MKQQSDDRQTTAITAPTTRGQKENNAEIRPWLAAHSGGGSPLDSNLHSQPMRHRPHAQTRHFATVFFKLILPN